MRNFLLLRVLDRFKFVFKKFKIDYPVLRKILQIKLLMDTRRLPSSAVNNVNKKKDKNYFFTSLLVYAFMGLFIFVPLTIVIDNMFVLMSIVFGILLFLITSTVISEFSTVLLDLRDKSIILTKPVENKTLSAAKFLHILNYLSSITFSLTLPLIITLFIKLVLKESLIFSVMFILVLLLEFILLNLFIIVITTLLYIFILKYFSGEKLKDIINYIQILLTITIIIGYQVVVRIFQFENLFKIDFVARWYHCFIPPLWFGAPFEVIFNNQYNVIYLINVFLFIFVPVVTFIIYLKLIPKFEESLAKLNSSDTKKKNKFSKWRFSKLLVKKEEHKFYKISSLLMKKERDFKLRVYPSLGISLVFPFIFIFQNASLGIEGVGIYYIYFCALMIPSLVMTLSYSSNYKGAWIYYTTPIKDKFVIVKASLKAIIIRLLLPLFIVESIIFIYILGMKILIDLLAVFLGFIAFVAICSKIHGNRLPMSDSIDNINKGQVMFIFLTMLILGIFPLFHYISSIFNYGIYIYCVILIIFNLIIWKLFFIKKS